MVQFIQDRKETAIVGKIPIMQQGKTFSIFYLRSAKGFNWASEIPMSAKANIYGAVIAQNGMLVDVEDNVAFNDGESEKV